tara:strand:- start:168993 stop:169514 length:522 start_codon:yes stop_codon:yes gene_type:complete
MENQQPTTGKFGLIYGVIAAVIGIVFTFMLIAGEMLFDPSPIKTVVQILIFVAVVAVTIFNFKKANNGYLSLGQALGLGAITALVTSIISIIFMYFLSSVIVPDFWEQSAEAARLAIQEQNPSLTSDQVENAVEMQGKFSWIIYPAILIMNLFFGFITALITGLILKKTENLD